MNGNKHRVILCLLTWGLLASDLSGTALAEYRVMAVQSIRIPPYEEALAGFEKACNCRIERFILSEKKGEDIEYAVRRSRPDGVLAIGREALMATADIHRVPVFYVMALNHSKKGQDPPNLHGVRMTVSPDAQLNILSSTLPEFRKMGTLYDPDLTGDFIFDARKAATRHGLDLVETTVKTPAGVPEGLHSMINDIQIFWLLPDLTVLTPETTHHIILSCLTRNMPVIAFSDKYLEIGALLSIAFDPADMGVQAGEMAKAVFQGADLPPDERHQWARTPVVKINSKIARKLGIDINSRALERAEVKKSKLP